MTDRLDQLRTALAGQYDVERVLGAGGMATVYLAKDLKHNRLVALKVLREDLSAALAGPRFVREIGIAASLAHPHILPVHDSGDANGCLYYVMPYVAGESLRQRLSRQGPLPQPEALAVAREVAAAIEYAHGQGVVHRDIKPENILIVEGRVWVADFGIARAVSAAGGDALTRPGVVVGTPGYMSPEQARGHDRVDGRSDVYSLGCVLHEMLTGRLPDPNTDWGADTPSPGGPALEGVPRQVRRALGRALAIRPGDRFRTAGDLRDALADHAGGSRLMLLARSGAIAAIAVAGAVAGFAVLLDRAEAPAANGGPRPTLLVLPFENLGSPEDDFFASGTTDEITARLAQVHGLGIIARQTALQYGQSSKTAMQIGDELGVDYILEATLSFQQAAGGVRRVRIRPQLIRTSDAVHLWADSYTEELDDVFAVQAAIAERVAQALHVRLLDPPRDAERPTANLDAYLAYLRGNDHYNRGWSNETHLRNALAAFEEAVALDSTFAQALTKLSMVHSAMHFGRFDERPERLTRARAAAERAVALTPELPDAHLALGLYYYRAGHRYDLALQEFAAALAARPNDPDVLEAAAYVHRRRGDWNEAVRLLERAIANDRHSPHPYAGLVHTLSMMRRWAEAEHVTRSWQASVPESGSPQSTLALLTVIGSGRLEEARGVLGGIGELADPAELQELRWWLSYLEGDYERALTGLALGRVPSGLLTWAARPLSGADSSSHFLIRAALLHLMSRPAAAAATFDTAAARLRATVAADSANAWLYRDLAVALAGTGQRDAAIRAARRAVDLLPIETDAVSGVVMLEGMALVYTMLGLVDDAIELLAYLLEVPSDVTAGLLLLDPAWAPLRTHPGFRALAANG